MKMYAENWPVVAFAHRLFVVSGLANARWRISRQNHVRDRSPHSARRDAHFEHNKM